MNVLSLTYLGDIQWFTKLCFEDCTIDVGEHYVKQSYRNRCEILTAGGRGTLVVNVSGGGRQAMKDVRIDYSKKWRHTHRMAIISAYGSAPFFDHYWPVLEPLFARRFEFLYDLSRELLEMVLRLLGSPVTPSFSESYVEGAGMDYRDIISPKPRLRRPDPMFVPAPYWQVFGEGAGARFTPDLSIIDLLFCEGRGALDILRRSTKAPDLQRQ